MADITLQDRFDALVTDSGSPGRRATATTVISRARRRRAGRVVLAAAAVLAVLGVAIPAVVGVADRDDAVDRTRESSPLSEAINPATAGWLGPWELASVEDWGRLPDPQGSTIGCFNDGELASAPTAYQSASSSAGRPEGALAGAVVSQHRSPARAEDLVPGIIRGESWCSDMSKPVPLTAPGSVTGTYRALNLDGMYTFMERAQPSLTKGELPRGYVLHAWSVVNADRAAMLLISAPSDAGAPPVRAVFEAFSAFMTTDAALSNSTPYGTG